MKKYHNISKVNFEGDRLVIIIDGKEWKFNLRTISSTLESASEKERNMVEISPSGYGIHWPLVDEDISVDSLLGIEHAPEWKKSVA